MASGLTILLVTIIFCFCMLLHFINKKESRLSLMDKFSLSFLVTAVIYFAYQIMKSIKMEVIC